MYQSAERSDFRTVSASEVQFPVPLPSNVPPVNIGESVRLGCLPWALKYGEKMA